MCADDFSGLIYLVTNLVSGKVYVGQTTSSLKRRWAGHVREASKNSQSPLHRAIRKYSKDAFLIEVLEWCSSIEQLDLMERRWVALKSSNQSSIGYNATDGGDRGFVFNAEVRNRISASVSANYKNRPDLINRLSAAAVAQFARPGAREAASERSSEMMQDPARRLHLAEVARKAIEKRPDLIQQLNAYNRSEVGRLRSSEAQKQFFAEHPEALEEMAGRAARRFNEDPITRERTLAALEKGRAARAAKRDPWVTLDEVRSFAETRTARQYAKDRPANMPGVASLLRVFGLTYGEIRNGHRGGSRYA